MSTLMSPDGKYFGLSEININSYPRKGEKGKIDTIIMIFFLNAGYLKKLVSSYKLANLYFNQGKDYCYVFREPITGKTKRYQGKDILQLMSYVEGYKDKHGNYVRYDGRIYRQLGNHIFRKKIETLTMLDRLYLYYFKNRNFYLKLYEQVDFSRRQFSLVKDYCYKVVPPSDFYNLSEYKPQIYSAQELLEIYVVVQKMNMIGMKLPLPAPTDWNTRITDWPKNK